MNKKNESLSLLDACGIAISGMIGGGIFAVLGEAVMTAGNSAFLSLGAGGILALLTGIVYSKLTVVFNEAGGEFVFIEHVTGPRFAGTISWFLILGYIFTISLYAYTFGAYAGRLLGFGSEPNFWLGSGVITGMTIANLAGVSKSKISENLLVSAKIFILTGLIILGFFTVKPGHIFHVLDHGIGSTVQAAALVFVAYEGFQLLTYDYDDIANHKENLPKAVVISIMAVIVIYMLIAFAVTGSVGPAAIARHKETALALIAEPVMGQLGVSIVLVAAIFSTASAVLVTSFSISRMAKRISNAGQLPNFLVLKKSAGVPVVFSILIALFSIFMQFFGNLTQITTYSSATFLFVFAVVNFMGFKHKVLSGWKTILPIVGTFGCSSALFVLLYNTYKKDISAIYILIGISVCLLLLREAYIWLSSSYKGRI